ncbi:hypothetical protein IE983_24315 [Enterobacter hormaechei]|uniref:Uncharacterized protein n=1 Tax=Enterobacter hormaechei TaxID=158836 RepID=A0A927DI87_9ENTR|nr:hypothetical protein [Enterobacter hormaechei]
MNLMQQGVIRSRQDVVTQLETYGLTVARETQQHQHCRSGRRPKYPAERNDL